MPAGSEVDEKEMQKGQPRIEPGLPESAASAPGDSPPLVYLALGDSFAAGEGAGVPDSCDDENRAFLDGTAVKGNHCHRSVGAYPVRLWEALEERDAAWTLDFRACSGARTENFENRQTWDDTWGPWNRHQERANPPQWAFDPTEGKPEDMDTTRDADLVTVTMTGNDIGFAEIVTDCVKNIYAGRLPGPTPTFAANCDADRDDEIAEASEELLPRLVRALDSMRQHLKPGGKMLLAGYPQPFPRADDLPGGCGIGAGATILREEMDWLNSVADQTNKIVAEAAQQAGVTYVSISDILQDGDHTLCSDEAGPGAGQRWMNRLIPSHREWSMHPTADMHAAEAERLLACINGFSDTDQLPEFCHYPLV